MRTLGDSPPFRHSNVPESFCQMTCHNAFLAMATGAEIIAALHMQIQGRPTQMQDIRKGSTAFALLQ